MNRLIALMVKTLDPAEREAVLGDLSESGLSANRAFVQVAGLVLRRQLLIWTEWRPWVGLLAIAGIAGAVLSMMISGVALDMVQEIRTWQKYGVHMDIPGLSFGDSLALMTVNALAIFCWVAANTEVLRRLSGKAWWLTGTLFYLVAHDASTVRRLLSGSSYGAHQPLWQIVLSWVLPNLPLLVLVIAPMALARAIWGRTFGFLTAAATITACGLSLYKNAAWEAWSGNTLAAAAVIGIVLLHLIAGWPALLAWRGGLSGRQSR